MKGECSRDVPKTGSQKMIFAPNCNCRGLLAVLFDLPKLDAFEMSLPGVPRMTLLNMLKASARNSMRRPSPQNGNCRKIDVSRFQYDGDRNASRPLLGSPTRLALSYCAHATLPVFAKSLAPQYTLKGTPDRAVKILLSCQFPRT